MRKLLFCANCQKQTSQSFRVVNDEIVAVCDCGRNLKFAAATPEELEAAFKAHEESNKGQVVSRERKDGTHPALDMVNKILPDAPPSEEPSK